MYSLRFTGPVSAAALLITFLAAANTSGCRQQTTGTGETGGYAVRDGLDCLPPITLLDQHRNKVSLAALKGKPALFDFIYTSCPGECLMLTQRMKRIAAALGPELGQQVRLVSVTVDPEHDQPKQLLQYASDQGADLNGWLFLTGTPEQIDAELKQFKLIRQREADGSMDHVLEMFLVGPDGRALLEYDGDKIIASRAIADLNAAAAGKAVTKGPGTIAPVAY